MGIQGLLVALKPHGCVPGNVRDFAGQALAIDASSWLHKSVYSIADHYVECIEKTKKSNNNGNNVSSYTLDEKCISTSSKYIIQRCQELLQQFGIRQVYLVMDGQRCPLKAGTNHERERLRQANLVAARKLKQNNAQNQSSMIFEKYKACIKVVPELGTAVADRVTQHFAALHHRQQTQQVFIVWSPYEADAQMVQLVRDGRCAAIVTEDSDVLVYSAACQVAIPILYKLDRRSGDCDIFSMDWLLSSSFKNVNPLPPPAETANSKENQPQQSQQTSEKISAAKPDGDSPSQLATVLRVLAARQSKSPGWGARLFVQACVLSGCDYAPRQIPGVGLVTAFKYVRNAGLTGSMRALHAVFSNVLFSQLPAKSRRACKTDLTEFEALLAQSEAVFYYHPVALKSGKVVHLNDMPAADGCEVIKHSPHLTRFQDKVLFLGSLLESNPNTNLSSGIIPNDSQPRNVLPLFFRACKRKRIMDEVPKERNHRVVVPKHVCYNNTTDDISHVTSLTSPSTTTVTETMQKPMVGRKVLSVSKMANPYNQNQLLLPHRRLPLHALSSTNVDNPNRSNNTLHKNQSPDKSKTKISLNPFEAYARRHREEGIARSNQIVTARLPVRRQKGAGSNKENDIVRTGAEPQLFQSTGGGGDAERVVSLQSSHPNRQKSAEKKQKRSAEMIGTLKMNHYTREEDFGRINSTVGNDQRSSPCCFRMPSDDERYNDENAPPIDAFKDDAMVPSSAPIRSFCAEQLPLQEIESDHNYFASPNHYLLQDGVETDLVRQERIIKSPDVVGPGRTVRFLIGTCPDNKTCNNEPSLQDLNGTVDNHSLSELQCSSFSLLNYEGEVMGSPSAKIMHSVKEARSVTQTVCNAREIAFLRNDNVCRRVTLDAQFGAADQFPHIMQTSSASAFNFYGPHSPGTMPLCPRQEVTSLLSPTVRQEAATVPTGNDVQSHSRYFPKENSTIGPAKTIRFRFCDRNLSSTNSMGNKPINTLKRFLHRNRKRSAEVGTGKLKRSNNNTVVAPLDANQTTLHKHFFPSTTKQKQAPAS